MSGALAAFEDLFQHSSPNPAVAAAVTLLCAPPVPPPIMLDAALSAVAPHLSGAERAVWASILGAPLQRAGIVPPRCVAAFLGQCAHESGGFRDLEEDLSYTAPRLCQVWPNRFPTPQAAEACALQPEMLANRVYANRLGNGDEASGDGWRFRGRGLIQITGRAAYQQFADAMHMTLSQAVPHASTQAGAVDSAIWFWTVNDLRAGPDLVHRSSHPEDQRRNRRRGRTNHPLQRRPARPRAAPDDRCAPPRQLGRKCSGNENSSHRSRAQGGARRCQPGFPLQPASLSRQTSAAPSKTTAPSRVTHHPPPPADTRS